MTPIDLIQHDSFEITEALLDVTPLVEHLENVEKAYEKKHGRGSFKEELKEIYHLKSIFSFPDEADYDDDGCSELRALFSSFVRHDTRTDLKKAEAELRAIRTQVNYAAYRGKI